MIKTKYNRYEYDSYIYFKQKTAYEMLRSLVGSEMCIRDSSKAIRCIWVFRKKDNEQYKAKLVAKGYAQKEGIDYNEIFFFCSQAYIYSDIIGDSYSAWFRVEQMDVKTTFLNSELEEKICMK